MAQPAPNPRPTQPRRPVSPQAVDPGDTQPSAPAPTIARAPVPPPRAGADQNAIFVQGLTKQFGDEFAVQDVSFAIPPGSVFGFIGPSGSGKTTAIRLLTGVYEPSSGQALVLGQPPRHFSARTRSRIGYMPQLFVLYPNLSVSENLNFAASLYGMGFFARRKRIADLLDFVELTDHRHKLARNISGGMQRRLALAATLVHDPDLIFLDEPTAGIDPVLRKKFWDYFRALRDDGHTLFITTQYVGEAAYCDLVGVMAEGRLLMVESPEGLRRRAFGGELVDITSARPLDFATVAKVRALPFVRGSVRPLSETSLRLTVADAGEAIPDIMEWAQSENLELTSVDNYVPPLDDVFVEVVQKETDRA